nr:DUF192 domain-containing protein [Bacteroidota bacterium]
AIAALILVYFVYGGLFINPNKPAKPLTDVKVKAPEFTIEGSLSFLDSQTNDSLATIYIEIVDDDAGREKGLMYRYFIPDTLGMLFIFRAEHYRSFWMKNTPVSLDIIYADKKFTIVSIQENTTPYSEASLPSGEKAKYVIEVVAGFTAQFGIEPGDRFSYKTIE